MQLHFSIDTPKELVFENVAEYLHHKRLKIHKQDNTRPWGGFFVIEENEAEKFIEKPDLDIAKACLDQGGYLWNSGIFIFDAEHLLKQAKFFHIFLLGYGDRYIVSAAVVAGLSGAKLVGASAPR